MFLQLNLKCFRQHVNKSISYVEGLNVIRGANESGKSTLEEAIEYALFGLAAMPQKLSEMVTWGHKESELHVEFLFQLEGRMFKYTRSSAGAQVEYDGGLVTGQNEVSKFTHETLGVDKDLAKHLLFAKQTDIRGAIDAKPGAVAELIETMANFELFDTLLSRMSEQLPLGNTKLLEGQVIETQAKFDALVLEEPDTSELITKVEQLNQLRATGNSQLNDLRSRATTANGEWQSALNMSNMHKSLQATFDRTTADISRKELELGHNKTLAATISVVPQITELEKQLEDVGRTKILMARGLEVERLMNEYPEVFWDEPYDKYVAAVEKLESELESKVEAERLQYRVLQGAEESIKSKQSTLSHDMTCPTCKRAYDNQSDLLAQNAQIEADIAAIKTRIEQEINPAIEKIGDSIANLRSELQTMRNLQSIARPYEAMAGQEFVEADLNFYPPKLKWVGQVDFKQVEGTNLQAKITELRESQSRVDQAKLRVPLLEESIQNDRDQLARLTQQMAECNALPDAEIAKLKETYNNLSNQAVALDSDIVGIASQLEEVQTEIRNVRYAYEQGVAQKDALLTTINKLKEDIEETEFNNALIAKVRKARPKIADQLWGMVLGSVSNMFSQMRGEASLVTKDENGFKVNGVPSASFSGSAKDLLGLSLRMSLMKTFLPSVSILVLDEPGAAMDDNRVSNMLGYIAAAGFDQVILITHEEISETFADHIITLG